MARFVFIVQRTGRGHLSQAVAMQEILESAGHRVVAAYTGGKPDLELPAYYREAFRSRLHPFTSPWFLTLPNKKGIYIGRTMLSNFLRAPGYIRRVRRLRKEIKSHEPDGVINFYELLGALAMRGLPSGIQKVGVGHHFLLHLENYPCGKKLPVQKLLLKWHSRIILRSCDRVLALSFRKRPGTGKIIVIPPLVRRAFRSGEWKQGKAYLVYLLQEGFIGEFIRMAREDSSFSCDVFSSLPVDTELPPGIRLHAPSEKKFREKMLTCKALLSTAGFDSLAEAACLGIPMAVVPSENHFEQQCNARDLEQSGLGRHLLAFTREQLEFVGRSPNEAYLEWVNSIEEILSLARGRF